MLPAERAAELAQGPVTIDIDATGVKVYGNKKRGVAYTYQGQRRQAARGGLGRDRDPAGRRPTGQRPGPALVGGGAARRALAALPQAVRDGAAAAGQKIRLRADAGYFAGTWPAPPPRRR